MDLHALSLLDALRALREGRSTVMELDRRLCARIAALDPEIHAWEWFEPSRAMAEAEERAGGILGDLPAVRHSRSGVKDIINTRGIPTRYGSPIYANHVPTTSAWVVRRLEALGGIVMGKTVTTEFAFRHPGKTRNPWNTAHTPGGSSSGSAAAVAAGFVPVGDRHADAGLGDPARGVLRRGGLQAQLRRDLAHRHPSLQRRRSTRSACSRARSTTRPGSPRASWGRTRATRRPRCAAPSTRSPCRSSRCAQPPRLAVVKTAEVVARLRGAAARTSTRRSRR